MRQNLAWPSRTRFAHLLNLFKAFLGIFGSGAQHAAKNQKKLTSFHSAICFDFCLRCAARCQKSKNLPSFTAEIPPNFPKFCQIRLLICWPQRPGQKSWANYSKTPLIVPLWKSSVFHFVFRCDLLPQKRYAKANSTQIGNCTCRILSSTLKTQMIANW